METRKIPGGEQVTAADGEVPPLAFVVAAVTEAKETGEGIAWARDQKKQAVADAADPVVVSLLVAAQDLKATVKAAAPGPLTLTKAQTLVILRGLIYLLKGDAGQ